MIEVRTVHTWELGRADLAAARDLLVGAFDGDFAEEDWEHALGGVHALVRDGGAPVAHGSVVQRRVLHGGRALRAGYVEAVGVRADLRRRGYGAAVMAALEEVLRGAYDLGVLCASDEAVDFYAARGWQRWRGPLAALTPEGVVATAEEEGFVLVLPGRAPLDLDGPLTCDWRDGDVW